MKQFDILKNNNGMALVLALLLTALLSLLGVWLMYEAGSASRITQAGTRHGAVLNLAEGALQLGFRCISTSSPAPSYENLIADSSDPEERRITQGLPFFMNRENAPNDAVGIMEAEVRYAGSGGPPPGWMITWQGYGSFHSVYYQPRGVGRLPLTASEGEARAVVSALTMKVTR